MIPDKVGMPLSVSHPCPSGRRSAGIRWVHGRQYGILLAHAAWAGGLVAARSETREARCLSITANFRVRANARNSLLSGPKADPKLFQGAVKNHA